MNSKDVEQSLLEIINMVQSQLYTPAEALESFQSLKKQAKDAGIKVTTEYTLGDFILIRENALSTLDDESPFDEDGLPTEFFDSLEVIDEETDEI